MTKRQRKMRTKKACSAYQAWLKTPEGSSWLAQARQLAKAVKESAAV